MNNIIAIASFVIVILATIPYIIDTIKKHTRPERISWLLWVALGATYLTSATRTDGAVLYILADFLVAAVILILSLKFGVGGKSRFDQVCLAVAIVAFILLLTADNPLYGLGLAVFIDAIGSMLTIRKLSKDRTSEPKWVWGMFTLAPLLAIIALENYSIENLLFPVYALVAKIMIFLLAKSNRNAKASKSRSEEIEKL